MKFFFQRRRFLVYTGGILSLLLASSGLADASLARSRVLLAFDVPKDAPAGKEQARVLSHLVDRTMALDGLALEPGVSATAIVAGRGPEGIYVDVDGLQCPEASLLVEEKLLDRNRVEIGLVGQEPLLQMKDVERAARTQDGDLILVLREEGSKRFRDLTANHIGESAYVSFGEGRQRAVISILTAIDSGLIQIDRKDVPKPFLLRAILDYRAQIADCSPLPRTL